MERNHRMVLQYDGTGLHGWAKQDGLPTVEGYLEEAFRTVLGAAPTLRVAGRTDAGVHARRQVVSLLLPRVRTSQAPPLVERSDTGWHRGFGLRPAPPRSTHAKRDQPQLPLLLVHRRGGLAVLGRLLLADARRRPCSSDRMARGGRSLPPAATPSPPSLPPRPGTHSSTARCYAAGGRE